MLPKFLEKSYFNEFDTADKPVQKKTGFYFVLEECLIEMHHPPCYIVTASQQKLLFGLSVLGRFVSYTKLLVKF